MSPDSAPDLAHMRKDYRRAELHREDLAADPFTQFTTWLNDACQGGVHEPNAMTLATAWADGRPLARTVLLKHFDAAGFVFYTNFESRKSRQLSENPHASLLFPWLVLERQVIITGRAEKVGAMETAKYFLTRPRESQLAAWASPQSTSVDTRKFLLMEWEAMKSKFSKGEIPVPPFWGGWRIVPDSIEFWQGGGSRLHDRFLYTRAQDGAWNIERLAP